MHRLRLLCLEPTEVVLTGALCPTLTCCSLPSPRRLLLEGGRNAAQQEVHDAEKARQMFALLGWPEGDLADVKPEDATSQLDDLLGGLLNRVWELRRAAEKKKEPDWSLFRWVGTRLASRLVWGCGPGRQGRQAGEGRQVKAGALWEGSGRAVQVCRPALRCLSALDPLQCNAALGKEIACCCTRRLAGSGRALYCGGGMSGG